MGRRRRPLGVLVLAILQVFSGIQLLFVSIASLVIAAILNSPEGEEQVPTTIQPEAIGLLVVVIAVIGVVALLMAIFSFLLARGYLRGREWSRRKGRQMALLAIGIAVISMLLFPGRADPGSPLWTIMFNVLVYLYLGRKRIRSYFVR